MRIDRRQRRRPPAWQQQRPGSDRSIETREPQIRAHPNRRIAIDPIVGGIGDASERVAHCVVSGFPVSVSNVPLPVFGVGVCEGLVPSASLSVGTAGAAAGPAEHTCLRIRAVWSWLPFICFTASAGIPQEVALTAAYLTIFSSAAAKVLMISHICSRVAFLSWAALAARPVFSTVSRSFTNSATQGGGCWLGQPGPAP